VLFFTKEKGFQENSKNKKTLILKDKIKLIDRYESKYMYGVRF
jgi:hypothetical protein